MLRGATAVIQSDYTSLQSDYSSPDRVIAASGRPEGEANADGNRNLPREIGAGRNIRIDAPAERGADDAHGRDVESVAATVARRFTGREPMLMASTATVAVTAKPVSGGAARGSDTHSTVAVGSGAYVSDSMPGTLSSESRRRMSSTTTLALRKRRDTWPVEVAALTAPRRPRVRASRPVRSRAAA